MLGDCAARRTAFDFVTNFADYVGQTIDVTIRMTNDRVQEGSVCLKSLRLDSTPPTPGAEGLRLP